MSSNTFQIVFDISVIDDNIAAKTSSSPTILEESSQSSQKSAVFDKVFVYDTDDITMLSKKQVAEITRNNAHSIDIQKASRLVGDELSKAGFGSDGLLVRDPINITNILDDEIDLVRTFEKYYYIIRTYEANNKDDAYNKELYSGCNPNWTLPVERWQYVKNCLELVNERSKKSERKKYANVVICEDGIAHGAMQLAIAGLSSQIPIENIYSTMTRCTETILKRIQERFGEQCKLVMVTSNEENNHSAQMLLIHVWSIKSDLDFESLYSYQSDFWLPTEQDDISLLSPIVEQTEQNQEDEVDYSTVISPQQKEEAPFKQHHRLGSVNRNTHLTHQRIILLEHIKHFQDRFGFTEILQQCAQYLQQCINEDIL